MNFKGDTGLTILGLISAFTLVSSFALSFMAEEATYSFNPDEDQIMNDIEILTSFGPRLAGSEAEYQAALYISQRYEEIGLSNVEIIEYEITGCWFEEPGPDDPTSHMHSQLEQGADNVGPIPDGAQGSGRVELDGTGNLEHGESFVFLGYSGGIHKHDNEIVFLNNGTASDYSAYPDLADTAVLVSYDGTISFADIYLNAIERNAAAVVVYQEGLEIPYFKTVVVEDGVGNLVPFPEAYPNLQLIPFVFTTSNSANQMIDFINEASTDSTKYAILDGNWEYAQVGTRTTYVVTGELIGNGEGTIMVGAHHDSTYLSPGAIDNAVGVAQLLEIANNLKNEDLDKTIRFATWGGEELGLLGSQKYIDQESSSLSDLELYINLDSTNLNPATGTGTLGIETTSLINKEYLEMAKDEVMDTTGSEYSVNIVKNDGGGGSDHRSFNAAGYETIGAFGWGYSEYHTSLDNPSIVNKESLGITPELILHVIMLKASSGSSPIIEISGLEDKSTSWQFPFMLTLAAGLATGLGGLIVYFVREVTPELMAFLLAMAAGVMLLISILDLWIGQALEFGFIQITFSFLIGASTVYGASYLLSSNKDTKDLNEDQVLYRSGILTAVALGIHNFPEGLAMGVAVLESAQYGVVLMIAIALHNIPEGIAVAAPIKAGKGGAMKAAFIALLTGLTEPLGALFALLILGSFLTPLMIGYSLAFVGGIMTVISFKELIPQAINQHRPKHLIVGMIFGAALMQLSLLLLGE
tara:strand:- start:423 stop:2684 length:2262 start_codon:yes stop_codon:yes gene_type:complete